MTPVLIVTRPTPQGDGFAQAVLSQWDGPLRVILSPLIVIKPVRVMADLGDITGVIFTSANGVAGADNLGVAVGTPAWCVGQKTAKRAQEAGFVPIVGPGNADGLVDLIIANRPKGILAHIRGRHSRGAVSQRLDTAGILCRDVIAYDQTACVLNADAVNAVKGKDPVLFPLFSPRTASILSKQGPFDAKIHLVMISDAVSDAVTLDATTASIAAEPEEAAMVKTTLQLLRKLTDGRN